MERPAHGHTWYRLGRSGTTAHTLLSCWRGAHLNYVVAGGLGSSRVLARAAGCWQGLPGVGKGCRVRGGQVGRGLKR